MQVVLTRETLLSRRYSRVVTTKLQGIFKSLMHRQIIEIIVKKNHIMKYVHLIETTGKKPEYDALRGFSRSIMIKC